MRIKRLFDLLVHWVPMAMPFFLGSCAELHHAQIGDIDHREGYIRERFEIKVSEEAVEIKNANLAARSFTLQSAREINDFARLFTVVQMGPRTGSATLSSSYGRDIYSIVRKACVRGWPTDLVIERESNSYPGISGEIIRILGGCQIPE